MESPCSSSTAANAVSGANAAMQPQLVFQNGAAVTGSSHFVSRAYLESKAVIETKALAADLSRHFYTLGWLSGTGGSITIKVHDDSVPRPHQLLVMSPSGVQKERMVPDDIYVLSSDGFIVSIPPLKPYPHRRYKCTDCALIFMKVYEICDAGAVIHSHGMEACIATMLNPLSKEFRITRMEMIKGIQGHGYHDELVLPIIENTAHEAELTESVIEAIRDYPKATAVLVRNHGVYIWGETWISAKTQAECYHYLFNAAIKLHQLGLDWSIPSHGPIGFSKVCGCGMNIGRGWKARPLSLGYMIEPSHCCILLNVEGTMMPLSFISNILLPYANDNVEKHLAATYDSEETKDAISLLRSQIQCDLDGGVVGAAPVPSNCVERESVIASLVANVDAMIRSNRKVTALKQLLGHIWKYGILNNELVGFVFDDVLEALERWHTAGIKVYIYSSVSREAQKLLFANSNFGNMRKYFSGFFDTTVGNKNERHSYIEILRTVGVDRLADMLFVTDVLQEALAARAAGLEVIISIRPGNGPLPENHGFRMIESLLEI